MVAVVAVIAVAAAAVVAIANPNVHLRPELRMSNQRTTFAKRQREQNKKDKFAAKQQRLAARRAEALRQKDAPPSNDDGVATPVEGSPVPTPTGDLPTDS